MKSIIFTLTALVILAGCDSWDEKGPAPLAREFMSVAYGGKASDVAVYVKFAPGDREAAVRAEAGTLSCLLDTTAVDDERSPRFGWLVTGAHCVQSECADGAVTRGPDGKPVACSKGDWSPATIEERTIQLDQCTPESAQACVGIDLEALGKAAESGDVKAPAVNPQ
jgi:hypothetical protein